MRASSARWGFALPAVLAVTGVVTLVFLVAITALASLTAEAASARARLRFMERALTAEATIAYMAATEPTSAQGFMAGAPRSLNEFRGGQTPAPATSAGPVDMIHIDGRPYAMDVRGALLVNLQDQAGMINLAALDDSQVQRFADLLGIAPSLARNVTSLKTDYVDKDSLRQPNGAEQSEYGGILANRPMLRPTEWLSLLGVRAAVDPSRWRSVRGELAADSTLPSINVNTASSTTLQVLFDISAPQAQAAIRARESAPFLSINDFSAVVGAPFTGSYEQLYTYPSARVVYIIRDTRSPWTYRARLTLTPSGLEQPLWFDQTELTEAPHRAVADTSNAPRFPYAPR